MSKYCQSLGCFRESAEHSLYCNEHLSYIPGAIRSEKKGNMNDVELFAVSILAMQQAVLMQGENDICKIRSEYPKHAYGIDDFSPIGNTVHDELVKRGIIKI